MSATCGKLRRSTLPGGLLASMMTDTYSRRSIFGPRGAVMRPMDLKEGRSKTTKAIDAACLHLLNQMNCNLAVLCAGWTHAEQCVAPSFGDALAIYKFEPASVLLLYLARQWGRLGRRSWDFACRHAHAWQAGLVPHKLACTLWSAPSRPHETIEFTAASCALSSSRETVRLVYNPDPVRCSVSPCCRPCIQWYFVRADVLRVPVSGNATSL